MVHGREFACAGEQYTGSQRPIVLAKKKQTGSKKEVDMNFSYAYGYGNSADDKHMLEICDRKFIIDRSGFRFEEIKN